MVTRNLCIPWSVCRSNGQTKHLLGQLNRVRVKEWAKPMTDGAYMAALQYRGPSPFKEHYKACPTEGKL